MAQAEHPRRRVTVNRIWHYHFGEGIVRTPNDFGVMGQPPTHPELPGWLAAGFRPLPSGGAEMRAAPWSVKPATSSSPATPTAWQDLEQGRAKADRKAPFYGVSLQAPPKSSHPRFRSLRQRTTQQRCSAPAYRSAKEALGQQRSELIWKPFDEKEASRAPSTRSSAWLRRASRKRSICATRRDPTTNG